MSASRAKVREDRAIRDAARSLVEADVAQIRNNLSGKSITERFTARVSEGASDLFEEAVDVADNHKGALAALIGAVILWFAHNPILSLFESDDDDDETESDPTGEPAE